MRVFLVERYLPSATTAEVAAAVDRLVGAAEGVRHLVTVLVVGEETGLSCFEATDPDTVAMANEAAGFSYDRIVEVAIWR